jgi:competence protein ComEC
MFRLLIFLSLSFLALPAAAKTVQIFFIDVDGGSATLIVGPTGDSMLLDAGWPETSAPRIEEVVRRDAKLKHIDYFIATHYHKGHIGGVEELARRIPISHFIDHGKSVETDGATTALIESYRRSAHGKQRTVRPGDSIPLAGTSVRVVAAAGRFTQPLSGSMPNPLCANAVTKDEDLTENGQSIGILLTFGTFRFLNLGDMTWNKEHHLACPVNLLGTIDVLQVSHHGNSLSGAPQHLWALAPKVAILNAGPRTPGVAAVERTLQAAPRPPERWQLHFSETAADLNGPERQIANLEEKCHGYTIKLTIEDSGRYTILNQRNRFTRTFDTDRIR